MTTFDELVGDEPAREERERLRSVHALLLEAGPPPELSPELERGPTLAMTLSRWRTRTRSRRTFIPAIAAALAVALIIGLSTRGHTPKYASIPLRGTAFAPNASATLQIIPTKSGNPRMRIEEKGLPPSDGRRYVVYLVRDNRRVAPCGSFTVTSANREVTQTLQSPYAIEGTDKWVVTAQSSSGATVTVLQ